MVTRPVHGISGRTGGSGRSLYISTYQVSPQISRCDGRFWYLEGPNCFHRLDGPINRKPRRVSADRVSLAPPATTNSLLLRSSNPLPISLSWLLRRRFSNLYLLLFAFLSLRQSFLAWLIRAPAPPPTNLEKEKVQYLSTSFDSNSDEGKGIIISFLFVWYQIWFPGLVRFLLHWQMPGFMLLIYSFVSNTRFDF